MRLASANSGIFLTLVFVGCLPSRSGSPVPMSAAETPNSQTFRALKTNAISISISAGKPRAKFSRPHAGSRRWRREKRLCAEGEGLTTSRGTDLMGLFKGIVQSKITKTTCQLVISAQVTVQGFHRETGSDRWYSRLVLISRPLPLSRLHLGLGGIFALSCLGLALDRLWISDQN